MNGLRPSYQQVARVLDRMNLYISLLEKRRPFDDIDEADREARDALISEVFVEITRFMRMAGMEDGFHAKGWSVDARVSMNVLVALLGSIRDHGYRGFFPRSREQSKLYEVRRSIYLHMKDALWEVVPEDGDDDRGQPPNPAYPPIITNQARLALVMERNRSRLLDGLQAQGRVVFERVAEGRKSFRVWFLDPGEHERVRAALNALPG